MAALAATKERMMREAISEGYKTALKAGDKRRTATLQQLSTRFSPTATSRAPWSMRAECQWPGPVSSEHGAGIHWSFG